MLTSRFRAADGKWLDINGFWKAITALAWIVVAESDPHKRERMLDTYSDRTRVMVQTVIKTETAKVLYGISGKWL